MNMDNTILFATHEKELETLIQSSEDIRSMYNDGIWHRKMCHANNEKHKTTNDRRNKTPKSRKN